jgi:hypothetical protein
MGATSQRGAGLGQYGVIILPALLSNPDLKISKGGHPPDDLVAFVPHADCEPGTGDEAHGFAGASRPGERWLVGSPGLLHLKLVRHGSDGDNAFDDGHRRFDELVAFQFP